MTRNDDMTGLEVLDIPRPETVTPQPPPPPRTLGLTVKNVGFLLDRLGEDCHPLQFLRELTQNSIEAIQRSKTGKGTIVWDVDQVGRAIDPNAPLKLSITDNGVGMSGPQMLESINKLASSGQVQALDANFGVGAKIAAATRNHAGLVYLSWQGGDGAMIHLWRDPTSGQYGLRQAELPNGQFDVCAPIGDEVKPEQIKAHGTKIVLLGMTPEQDTMVAPAGAASPSAWIARYLNSRYYRIPEGITLRARQGWTSDNEQTNLLRQITGQEPYLRKHEIASGTLRLHGATAHWWILADSPALSQNSGLIESAGHVAALHKDELYELTGGRQGIAKLQQFGILFGARQVVIYIEPDLGPSLTSNTARTNLLLGQKPLPWSDWSSEFRDRMPKRLADFMEEIAARGDSKDHSVTIRERLKVLLDLFSVKRYRSQAQGDLLIADSVELAGGEFPKGDGDGVPSDSSSTPTLARAEEVPDGGSVGGVYSTALKSDGRKGATAEADPFPTVQWVSSDEGTRERGDLEDKAARYLEDQNTLIINGDFRSFADMEQHWVDEYTREHGRVPALRQIVRDVVHAWYEQSLVEAIIGLQGLRGSRQWSVFDLQDAWSEAALTSVVMQHYHPYNAVKRDLAIRISSLKTSKTK